ncbi:MAG: DUF1129 family protein [Streptococcaceae bacterium]|jgi:uncharacterized membrane-anchored protein|nr:DUF1129 family protein [Streptococcaceae bacterium]
MTTENDSLSNLTDAENQAVKSDSTPDATSEALDSTNETVLSEENSSVTADSTSSATTEPTETPKNALSNLTSKNSDYVHSVTRQLMLSGKSDSDVKVILAEILPQILEAQKDGTTARALLGTPTDFVAQYKPKTEDKNSNTNKNPWLMMLDSTLLIFCLLALVSGAISTFEKNAMVYGLISLIVTSIAGGAVMYAIYRFSYAPKDDTPKNFFAKHPIIFVVLAMLGWIILTTLTGLLPLSINIHPQGPILIAAAAISFALRYYLKQHFHIQSAMAQQRPAQKK